MTKHTYKAGAVQEGRLDRAIFEIETDGDQETGKREFLGLPVRLRGEYIFDIVTALQRAYQQGREDRGAELHQLPGDGDRLTDQLRAHLLGALEGWGPGWTDPAQPDFATWYIGLTGADHPNGELRWEVSETHHLPGRRFRTRLVIEEIK
jgi:hypothetical protein